MGKLLRMAIYHFSAKTFSRAEGRSTVAGAAYRAGEKMLDARTGEIHNYTRKSGVNGGSIFLPGGGTMNRQQLWGSVEERHKRGDAMTAREFEIALPAELTLEQRQSLIFRYAKELANTYNVAVDTNLHAPRRHKRIDEAGAEDHNKNWHAHVMLSACYCDANGVMGNKAVELDPIHCKRAKIANPMETQRARWQDLCNGALEAAGHGARIDHRTLEAQGITDRPPGIHFGPAASAIESRGENSEIGTRARTQIHQFITNMESNAAIAKSQESAHAEVKIIELALAMAVDDAKREEAASPLTLDQLKVDRVSLTNQLNYLFKKQIDLNARRLTTASKKYITETKAAIPALIEEKRLSHENKEIASTAMEPIDKRWFGLAGLVPDAFAPGRVKARVRAKMTTTVAAQADMRLKDAQASSNRTPTEDVDAEIYELRAHSEAITRDLDRLDIQIAKAQMEATGTPKPTPTLGAYDLEQAAGPKLLRKDEAEAKRKFKIQAPRTHGQTPGP